MFCASIEVDNECLKRIFKGRDKGQTRVEGFEGISALQCCVSLSGPGMLCYVMLRKDIRRIGWYGIVWYGMGCYTRGYERI